MHLQKCPLAPEPPPVPGPDFPARAAARAASWRDFTCMCRGRGLTFVSLFRSSIATREISAYTGLAVAPSLCLMVTLRSHVLAQVASKLFLTLEPSACVKSELMDCKLFACGSMPFADSFADCTTL